MWQECSRDGHCLSENMVSGHAWCVPTPAAFNYVFWWPWLKNYPGEFSAGYDNNWNFAKFVWIDQDMKQQITGRR